MLMQIYADVTNRDIYIAASDQAPALGAAIYGAIAAGSDKGGYDSLDDATNHMSKLQDKVYIPIAENVEVYHKLFDEYKKLHDYFGRGQNNVMKVLKNIKSRQFIRSASPQDHEVS